MAANSTDKSQAFVLVTEDYTAKPGDICLVTTSADHPAIVVTLPESFGLLPQVAVQPPWPSTYTGPGQVPAPAARGLSVTIRYSAADPDTEGQYVQVYAQTDSSIDNTPFGAISIGGGVELVTDAAGVWHATEGFIST